MGRVVDAVTDKEMALLIGCSMYDEATKHDVSPETRNPKTENRNPKHNNPKP